MATNTLGYATPGFVSGVPLNHPGTQQAIIAKGFKKRLRDMSILPYITNNTYQGEFKHAGTEIQIPILPIITPYRMKPGDKVKYQIPKSTVESFHIGREMGVGLHNEVEDELFARFDINSPILTEASASLNDKREEEFGRDILSKCASFNQGNTAGWMSKDTELGALGGTNGANCIKLLKNGTPSSKQKLAVDYFVEGLEACSQYPGNSNADWKIVCHSPVAARLQTSELKNADMTGDSTSVIRGSVRKLGRLGDADIFVDNRILPVIKEGTATVYPILFIDKSAISFVEEVVLRDMNMKDIDYWGSFNRTKVIYDWFVLYPERFGVGYVTL